MSGFSDLTNTFSILTRALLLTARFIADEIGSRLKVTPTGHGKTRVAEVG